MTASSTPSVEPSINKIILLAYKRAGLLPVEATLAGPNMTPKLEHGRQLLDLALDNLAVKGFIARTTVFYNLTIVAGTSDYAMPSTTLDVFEDAMFIPSSNGAETLQTQGEMVCKQVDVTTWQLITSKGSESSRPTMYTALRSGATVTVRFWPVPSDAGVMRMKTIRLLGDNSTGTNTIDLHRYWTDAIVWKLAATLAVDSSLPLDRCGYLEGIAKDKIKECTSYAFEHTSTQAILGGMSQWTNGYR